MSKLYHIYDKKSNILKQRSEFHLAFAMYGLKYDIFRHKFQIVMLVFVF